MDLDLLAQAVAPLPPERLGSLLKGRRLERGVSLGGAAKAAGLEERQLADAERGLWQPPVHVLARILDHYGVDPAEFVPVRVGIDPALLTGGNPGEILSGYLDLVRQWRAEPQTEHMQFRADDLRILVGILGLEPVEVERRLRSYTKCTRAEARTFRRIFLRGVAVLPVAALLLGGIGMAASASTASPPAHTISTVLASQSTKVAASQLTTIGVLRPDVANAATTRAAGVNTVVVEAAWDRLEPTKGQVNQAYAASLRQQLLAFQKAGLQTILDPGLQYPPSWVLNLDASSHFVDQYGNAWTGSPGSNVADAVWDNSVRHAQQEYLKQLGQTVSGIRLNAVRSGGLINGELRLPSGQQRNSYWAFSPAAQAQSPVPGWHPGDPDKAKAAKFLSWYLGSLTNYQGWLINQVHSDFPSVTVQQMYPSWGLRPGDIESAVNDRLSGNTFAQQINQVQEGLDWKSQVAKLPAGTMVYSTYLEAADRDQTVQGEAPMTYLASLARSAKLPVGGESSGDDNAAALSRCVQQSLTLGLKTMVWMNEGDLYAKKADRASLADLTVALKQLKPAV